MSVSQQTEPPCRDIPSPWRPAIDPTYNTLLYVDTAANPPKATWLHPAGQAAGERAHAWLQAELEAEAQRAAAALPKPTANDEAEGAAAAAALLSTSPGTHYSGGFSTFGDRAPSLAWTAPSSSGLGVPLTPVTSRGGSAEPTVATLAAKLGGLYIGEYTPPTTAPPSYVQADTAAVSRFDELLVRRAALTEQLSAAPYDLVIYLRRAAVYAELDFPDLAVGDAYRALLLVDEVLNEGFEYHDRAIEELHAFDEITPDILRGVTVGAKAAAERDEDDDEETAKAKQLARVASLVAYRQLATNFLRCGCLRSALSFCARGLGTAPDDVKLLRTKELIAAAAERRLGRKVDLNADGPASLPDNGRARREVYPWNDREPDRFAVDSLAELNETLSAMAPKCAVQAATLPVLTEGGQPGEVCSQLGVFAIEDIAPGEVVLNEYSLLTANTRLKDAVCDACSTELEGESSGDAESGPVQCEDCGDTVFCSMFCHDQAMQRYHPAVCGTNADEVGKDPDPREADDTLYSLLLARVIAMAAHEEIHPLAVREVKFIWGDFVPAPPLPEQAEDVAAEEERLIAGPPASWALPFSFKYSLEVPLAVLERMDRDIFETAADGETDTWVLNSLYAKFRGTASARKAHGGRGAPDVAAVHPYWCLANHDCDPNVGWEWGGHIVLTARPQRVWADSPKAPGVKKGEEILNHYCDVTMPVALRREWASGPLGGDCMCRRCRIEAGEVN